MLSPETLIESIPKIKKTIHPALRKLGIKTLRDLLYHFPFRYEDFSNRKRIREVSMGEVVTVEGDLKKITAIYTARKHMTIIEGRVVDDTGELRAVWFNQPFLARNLKVGTRVFLSGKISLGPKGLYLQNPAYERVGTTTQMSIHTGALVPIYPETRGITSRWLRFLIRTYIDLRRLISDPLPEETRKRCLIPPLGSALYSVHFPKSLEEAHAARRRFNFEELLLLQLNALIERIRLKQKKAPEISFDVALMKRFVASLPYSLTDAQRRSLWEIIQDISRPQPMNRLLEGDVGSGKTVVAAGASLAVTRSGYRVALISPTEILARQHYETLTKVLTPFGISISLWTASQKILGIEADVVVGTHALIEEHVRFQKLGLVIVDEQHRFGVEQRSALLKKGEGEENMLPHFLSMSATPIPRTLALTVYGDLDISLLDEMPKSRKHVITKIIEPEAREDAYRYIREEIQKGRQVFVICPRIEAEEENALKGVSEMKAVKEEFKKLSENIFPDFRVAQLHGKMKPKDKEETMQKFKQREYDILVSTSVIEVGVDIPNATIMMIEGAERFGLAQLHQFRGRVGRGEDQSYCLLFAHAGATRRLRAVVEAKNGFELAEKDLEIRGPGDLFGTRQWGLGPMLAAAITDGKLVREVRREALEIVRKDPTLARYPELQRRFREVVVSAHLE